MKSKLKNELISRLGSDNVISSKPGLEAYSSDASIYSSKPELIITPRTINDLRKAIPTLLKHNQIITARGGGSGLSGGAVSEGCVLDFSRMNRILRFNPQGKNVEVESGIVYEKLNRFLAPYKLFFPPDPSSGDTCQIGGMLGNNSSGPRSVKYGTTRKYVDEMTVFLPDGYEISVRDYKLGSQQLTNLFNKYPAFYNIYKLIIKNHDLILNSFPRLKKNVCGYDLKAVVEKLDQGVFSLPQLFIGSEGTLGVFASTKLRLLPLPSHRLTSLILFEKLDEVAHATLDFLELNPAGLELIDGNTLDLIGRENFDLPKSSEAMLIVEFDDPPFEDTIEKLKGYLGKYSLSNPPKYETDPVRQSALWAARKAIVPTLYRLDKNNRPWGFIEDAAIPSDKMPEFIRYLNKLFQENNLMCGIFGHIGDGNLHVRPAINLASKEGQELARKLYDRVYEKIFNLGGSATAEHGDGRLRPEVVSKQYGSEIYKLFERIKRELDPDNKSNPSAVISTKKFTDYIDIEKVVRECAACGKCNNYCPAYSVNRTENMSARGWVRIMLSEQFSRKESWHELNGCLNCKSCATVCPAGVDVSEYVIARRSEHPSFWGKRIFNMMEKPGKFERFVLSQGKLLSLIDKKSIRPIVEIMSAPVLKINRNRILPKIARQSFIKKYEKLTDPNRGEVAYFYGCADNYLESKTASSVVSVLENHGFKVVLPQQKCCGMPQQTYGYREHEKRHAIYNLESLDRYKYVIFSCATCLGEIMSYQKLFNKGDRYYETAKSVASKCYDISEFIINHIDLKIKSNGNNIKKITFHPPCHLRETGRHNKAEELLKQLPGVEYKKMEDAEFCCGSAGSYNIFHYDDSMQIFSRKKQAVEKIDPDLILSNCPTCILQFQDGLKSTSIARHSVELINKLCGFNSIS